MYCILLTKPINLNNDYRRKLDKASPVALHYLNEHGGTTVYHHEIVK